MHVYIYSLQQDPRATDAMAALNGAWEVLRCPKKRQDYNQSLQAQALKRQAEEKKKHFINSIAVKQKQNHEQREAHKVSATAKQKARSTTETKESVSEKKAANGSSFVYVCLTNQKKAIVVKSSSRKSLHRKFEHHNFVSAKHADAVASEFANRVENWCVETLCMNKIAQLEEFMMQQDIEKPAKRVSKVFLQEYIEEAMWVNAYDNVIPKMETVFSCFFLLLFAYMRVIWNAFTV